MVGGAGQSVAMFLLGALSKVAADQKSTSIGAAAGSFIFIYNFVFAVSSVVFRPWETANFYIQATWLSVPWVCE